MNKVYIYRGFERFWHWMQAALIIFLGITGFEIHGTFTLFGFESAAKMHIVAAYSLIVLIVFAVFWHFTTGEWKQYVPTFSNLKKQADYYIFGIFKNAPHPTKKTVLSKLNPLQRLTYLGLKLILIPIVISSGVLYLLYRFPQGDGISSVRIADLGFVAVVHTAGAFLLVAFLITHLYLITTGHTVSSNLKAMITGYEELEENEEKESDLITENVEYKDTKEAL